MQMLYAVIDDVYDYTVRKTMTLILGLFEEAPLSTNYPSTTPEYTQTPIEPALSESSSETSLALPTFRAVSTIIDDRHDATQSLAKSIAYIGSARAPLFATPTKEFDTVITTLEYGAMVIVLEEQGRFSKVSEDGFTGWVLRDDLADRAAHVYPEFIVGHANHAHDPNTERLRAVIGDQFYGGESEVPLQAGEYVSYKLFRKGLTINWPPARPRIPGRWHIILRGAPGIHIGVQPKGGSIMESVLENDIGHLAYVEAVFPDERITITEVNNPSDGVYQERTLSKEEWQAQNPVFITVS